MKKFIVIALLLVALNSQASGMLVIEGKLVSITKKAFIVRTEIATYSVDKSAVGRSLAEKIDRPEVPVKFNVPFEAVNKIKPLTQ